MDCNGAEKQCSPVNDCLREIYQLIASQLVILALTGLAFALSASGFSLLKKKKKI